MYKTSLFIFRRDLRCVDNTALIAALKQSEKVIPVFIFDPRQVGQSNAYRGTPVIQFMIESLEDLQGQLEAKGGSLSFCYGLAHEEVERIIEEQKIDAVFFNKDYTPFALDRDDMIKALCEERGVACHGFDDVVMHAPGKVVKDDGKPYTVYTPFYRRCMKDHHVESVSTFPKKYKLQAKPIKGSDARIIQKILPNRSEDLLIQGGRSQGLMLLKKIKNLKEYQEKRDFPSLGFTSKLSAHHKFGTVSIREVFHQAASDLGIDHTFIKEIYWREFYTHISYHFPHIYGGCFYKQYDALQWSYDKKAFKCWCEGKTGFPIVDAGMRELNQTGYMHNRVRMIVSSFLTKDLHIDWRRGEKYFAQKLIDYDPAVNNGSWQWAASTGCDAAPYFRIFNPWLQGAKFDVKAEYIKKWIPELHDVDPKAIHKWYDRPALFESVDYPKPILDHHAEKERSLAMFKSIK